MEGRLGAQQLPENTFKKFCEEIGFNPDLVKEARQKAVEEVVNGLLEKFLIFE